MKHKHAELIKQWVDNTCLVVLTITRDSKDWYKSSDQVNPLWTKDAEYFLVPEKHVEVALHFLNGGEVELMDSSGKWVDTIEPDFIEVYEYRIKPQLETVKVWVGMRRPKASGPAKIVIRDAMPCNTEYINTYTWTEVEVLSESTQN
jgi:hypothetical protein